MGIFDRLNLGKNRARIDVPLYEGEETHRDTVSCTVRCKLSVKRPESRLERL